LKSNSHRCIVESTHQAQWLTLHHTTVDTNVSFELIKRTSFALLETIMPSSTSLNPKP